MGSTERYVKPNMAAKKVVFNRLAPLRLNTDSTLNNIFANPGNTKQTVAQLRNTQKPKPSRIASTRWFWRGQSAACRQDFLKRMRRVADSPSSNAVRFW